MFAKDFKDFEILYMTRGKKRIVYRGCGTYRDYKFRIQTSSAVVTIINTGAECHGRESNMKFPGVLNISKSPCNEVKSMNFITQGLNCPDKKTAENRRAWRDRKKNSIAKLLRRLK